MHLPDIYISKQKTDAIDKALVGMVNVFVRDKLLVPVKEYPDLLKQVKSSDVEIRPGIYVRIKRGFIEETWQLLIICPRMV